MLLFFWCWWRVLSSLTTNSLTLSLSHPLSLTRTCRLFRSLDSSSDDQLLTHDWWATLLLLLLWWRDDKDDRCFTLTLSHSISLSFTLLSSYKLYHSLLIHSSLSHSFILSISSLKGGKRCVFYGRDRIVSTHLGYLFNHCSMWSRYW